MKTARPLIASLMVAAGLGLSVAPAFAQMRDCGPMGQGQSGNWSERRAERMEQRQLQMHDALKLTPDQEAAWKKYSESMQSKGPMGNMREQRDDFSKLTAPERADKMLELSKQHQERMADHVAALKTFYATLTPEQKKVFDSQHMARQGERRGPPKGDAASPAAAAK